VTEAYIYDAVRTPRGRGKADGALHGVTSVRLSADILDALLERNEGASDSVADVSGARSHRWANKAVAWPGPLS